MSKLKEKTGYFLLALLLLGMIVFGSKAYTHAIAFEKATTELVTHQGAKEQAQLSLETFAKSILGGLVNSERNDVIVNLKEKQHFAMQEAQRYTRYTMYLLGTLMLSYFYVPLRIFTLFGALATLVSLVLGLVTPILMVTIHKEVEYVGDIVLSFESKGIIGSIEKLFSNGDVVVALVILIFSVIVPVLKVLSLLFVSVFMQFDFAHTVIRFFKLIGKWSMVDVFVVAVFLVYLTANKAEVSRAEVEVGLYFFLGYVIVSMILSLSADKMLREANSVKTLLG